MLLILFNRVILFTVGWSILTCLKHLLAHQKRLKMISSAPLIVPCFALASTSDHRSTAFDHHTAPRPMRAGSGIPRSYQATTAAIRPQT